MTGHERSLLVTGAGGLVGGTVLLVAERSGTRAVGLHRVSPPPGGVESRAVDLLDEDATAALIRELRPWGMIHCAAAADPAACEQHPEWARRVNADLPPRLAGLAAELGARFLHVSTGMVFDGARGSYTEEDEPRPISLYGRTKLSGERGVLERLPDALVVRTTIQYGGPVESPRRQDLALRRKLEAGTATGFLDEYRSPLHCEDLAAALIELVRGTASGLLHVAGPDRVNRFDFAVAMAEALGLPSDRVVPGRAADLEGAAPRPADTSLDSRAARALLKTRIQGLADGLALLGALEDR